MKFYVWSIVWLALKLLYVFPASYFAALILCVGRVACAFLDDIYIMDVKYVINILY